ncbi:MAG TPA: hypothetical protein VFR10_09350, partial [bacterium]|nr:hypothetical protein [bacterium]
MFRPLAGLFLAIVLVNAPANAARIAYFNDPAFVDMTGEGARLQAALQAQGHTLTLFQGTALSAWTSATTGNDVVVIPELEVGDLQNALPLDTRQFLAGYVLSGNGLLTIADFTGNATLLLNNTFGLGITFAAPGGVSALNGGGVAGTPFAGGPATLPNSTSTGGHTTASLPPGSLSIYAVAGITTVFTTTVGARGRVACLGFDWDENPPPVAWNDVLGRTITQLEGATTRALRIAVFEDGTFVDLAAGGEMEHLRDALEPMGHQLISFTTTSAAAWQAALSQADVFILPENDFGFPQLLPALPAQTRAVFAQFVLSGGGLVIHGDNNAPTTTGTFARVFLNTIFGFSLVSTTSTFNNNLINLPDASATAFAAGPPILPGVNAVNP